MAVIYTTGNAVAGSRNELTFTVVKGAGSSTLRIHSNNLTDLDKTITVDTTAKTYKFLFDATDNGIVKFDDLLGAGDITISAVGMPTKGLSSVPVADSLLPQLSSGAWVKHTNAVIEGENDLELTANNIWQNTYVDIPAYGDKEYKVTMKNDQAGAIFIQTYDSNNVGSTVVYEKSANVDRVIKTRADAVKIRFVLTNGDEGARFYIFKNPALKENVVGERVSILPLLNSGQWAVHPEAEVQYSNDLEVNASGKWKNTEIVLSSEPNKQYTFTVKNNDGGVAYIASRDEAGVETTMIYDKNPLVDKTFTTPSDAVKIRIVLGSGEVGKGYYWFTGPKLYETVASVTPVPDPNNPPPPPKPVLPVQRSVKKGFEYTINFKVKTLNATEETLIVRFVENWKNLEKWVPLTPSADYKTENFVFIPDRDGVVRFIDHTKMGNIEVKDLAFTEKVVTQPSPPQDPDVLDKLEAKQTVKIVAYGASITHGWNTDASLGTIGSRVPDNYPKLLQDNLRTRFGYQQITVVNEGHSGWQTDEALNNFNTKVVNHQPDAVIIQFGVNDVRGSNFGGVISLNQYKINLGQLIDKAREYGIDVIMSSSTKFTVDQNGGIANAPSYAQGVKDVALSKGVPFVDIFHKVQADATTLGDGIHFKPNKYHLVSDQYLAQYFKKTTVTPAPPETTPTPDPAIPAPQAMSVLKVGGLDNRKLVRQDGSTFFYLADTAWELTSRLSKVEIDLYLDNRKAKGFNVVQFCIAPHEMRFKGSSVHAGTLGSPTSPNATYMEHVDYALQGMQARGMYAFLLPIWGNVDVNKISGYLNPEFHPETGNQGRAQAISKARSFGEYLGKRYKNMSNIIWVLGGDTQPEGSFGNFTDIYKAMADGLSAGDGKKFLRTWHSSGGTSSKYLNNVNWIDFHTLQTGHDKDLDVYNKIRDDRAKFPTKPVIDQEPRYEDIRSLFWNANPEAFMRAFDVRQAGYWAVLSGSAGVSYGNAVVIQFYPTPKKDPMFKIETTRNWKQAMDREGAFSIGYMRRVFDGARLFSELIPEQGIIASANAGGASYRVSAKHRHGHYAFVYLPYGGAVTINMGHISGANVRAKWFDPRTGATTVDSTTYPNTGTRVFTSPTSGTEVDWLLILDDDARNFPNP